MTRPWPLYALSECFALRLLVSLALHFVQVALVIGEHGVEEVRVGVDRLLGQRPGSLTLLALLLDQVLIQGPVALCLGPQVVDNSVEEILRQLGVELLCRDGAVRDGLVGFFQRIGELLRRFFDLSLLLLVHYLTSPFSVNTQSTHVLIVTRYQGRETSEKPERKGRTRESAPQTSTLIPGFTWWPSSRPPGPPCSR